MFLIYLSLGFKELLTPHGEVCTFFFQKCPLDPYLIVVGFSHCFVLLSFLNRKLSAPSFL